MILERGELLSIMPRAEQRVDVFLLPLNEAMIEFGITSAERMAAFLAQVAHESGELRYTEEIASGEAYEGRLALGNTEPGDGPRFKGRGLLQITGRANYRECSAAFNIDFVANPGLLASPEWACRSAGWYWASRKLNALADYGDEESFRKITLRINGGYNGWEERLRYWRRAQATLGV